MRATSVRMARRGQIPDTLIGGAGNIVYSDELVEEARGKVRFRYVSQVLIT